MALKSLIVRIGADSKELDKALASVGASSKNVSDGLAKLGGTTIGKQAVQDFDRLQKSMMAVRAEQERIAATAANTAAGIEHIGGVTKLTDQQLQSLNRTIKEGVSAFKVLGKDVPPSLQKIADQTSKLNVSQRDLVGTLTKVAGAFGIAFSAQAIIGFGKRVFDTASEIHDMALKLGISAEAVQGFGFAAKQAGSSLDAVGTAITRMNVNLSEGDKGTVSALRQVGLEFHAIRQMKPEDAFLAITDAVAKVPDPMIRSEVALKLFGKSAAELLPAIAEGFRQTSDSASKMSNETVDSLERAQDAWSKAGNAFTIVTGTMLAKVIDLGAALHEIIFPGFSASMKKVRGDIELLPDVVHKTKEEIEALTKSQHAAAAAAAKLREAQEKYADSLRDIVDVLSGAGAIDKANLYMQALKQTVGVTQMTEKAQKALHEVLQDALEVYARLGQEPPQAMLEIWAATEQVTRAMVDLEKIIPGITHQLQLMSTAGGQELGMQGLAAGTQHIVDQTDDWRDALHNVVGMMSIVGDKWSTVAAGILRNSEAIVSIWQGDKSKGIKGNKTAAVGMALGVAGSLIPTDSKAGSIAGGAAQGAAVGSIAGPIGLAVGAGVGALIGWYKSGKAARQVNDVRDAFVAQAGGLAALDARAHAAGVTLTAMLDAKNPKAYEQAINDLTAAMDFQDQSMQFLNDTMAKYGLSVTDMGAAFAQQNLDEQAANLVLEFRALEAAGANVETISGAMSAAIQDYVTNALKAGVAVPSAMHDIVQQLISQGLLLDENGEAFTSLEQSGITFAQTQGEQFDTLIDKIEKLVDAITRGLGGAIDSVPDVTVGVHFDPDPFPNIPGAATGGMVTGHGIQQFAGGGRVLPFLRRGGDSVPAMLSPGEIVLNAAQQGSVADALGGGSVLDMTGLLKEIKGVRASQERIERYQTGRFAKDLARTQRDELQKVQGRRR